MLNVGNLFILQFCMFVSYKDLGKTQSITFSIRMNDQEFHIEKSQETLFECDICEKKLLRSST